MPKLILEFDFNTEQDQYEDAANGDKWHSAMQEVASGIKHIIEHREDWAKDEGGIAVAKYINGMIYGQLNARRLELFK